ncbi:hypothetical protein [Pseudaestuariivita rosea]|uniref:hypothetical protein n=1 Tax=Pseudaestuariivita rosea TaxID=2763263 RepID=UPI001ABB6F95|nr:hypothetical protein [Pseudaestuariivita rosea]
MTGYFTTRRTLNISLGMGLIGLGFGVIMQILHVKWDAFYLPDPPLFLMAAFAGGFAGGLSSAWTFGRSGGSGLLWALGGGILATTIGAAVGGAAFSITFGALVGIMAVADAMISYPITVVPWLVMMLILHALTVKWPRHLMAS